LLCFASEGVLFLSFLVSQRGSPYFFSRRPKGEVGRTPLGDEKKSRENAKGAGRTSLGDENLKEQIRDNLFGR